VVPPVRELVETDVLQVLQTIGGAKPSNDTLDDLADRAPGDPQHARRGRPVRDLGEVGRLILEVAGESRAGFGPGHELSVDLSAAPAGDASLPILEGHLHAGEIQVPPFATPMVVHVPRSTHARRAVRHARRWRDLDLEAVVRHLESCDASLFQREQGAE